MFYDFLYEKQLLLPFFILLSIVSIYSFDRSQLESILLVLFTVIYTIRLLFSTRIARKNERYVYIEDNRVKNIAGPGIITLYSINKYIKVDLNVIAPDLINEKYDYKLKNRINKHLKSGSLYI